MGIDQSFTIASLFDRFLLIICMANKTNELLRVNVNHNECRSVA